MKAFFGVPRSLASAYARRLSVMTFSHLLVVVISEAAYLIAAILVLSFVASLTGGTNLPEYSPAMAQETRALAALVADPLATRSSADLSTLLASLPATRRHRRERRSNGSLSPNNVLVVVTPDLQIRASSSATCRRPATQRDSTARLGRTLLYGTHARAIAIEPALPDRP